MGATHAVAGSKLAIVQSDASPMNSSCALPSVWSTLMGRSMAAGAVHAIDLESPARKLSTASRSDRTEAQTASPSTNRFLPNVAALSEKHSHRLLGGVTGPIGFKGYTMIYTICFSFARTGPAKPAVLKHILFYEAAKGQQTGPRPTAAAPHARMQRPVAGLMAVPPLHEKCGMAPGSPLEVNYILCMCMSGPLSLPHGTRHGRSQGQPCLQGSETRHMDAGISSYASDSSPALVPAFAPAFVPALAPTGAARWERAAGAGTRARVRLARRKGATAATAVVGAVDTDATASGATPFCLRRMAPS